MACTNCNKTSVVVNCTSGCTSTIKTDCVIYDSDPLSFEGDDVESGDKRTLTSLLELIQGGNTKKSNILAFNDDGTTDNGTAYTVVEADTQKVILFTQTDDGDAGTRTYTITLPQTSAFINKELIFKDISAPSTGGVTIVYQFNIDIQYEWNPLAVSDQFDDLCDSTHRTLKLRFVKVTPTSYQWLVCP